jgi:hypothetical protein
MLCISTGVAKADDGAGEDAPEEHDADLDDSEEAKDKSVEAGETSLEGFGEGKRQITAARSSSSS